MAECSIAGDELRGFRLRGLKLSLRAFWTALPLVAVALLFWNQELMLLIIIPGLVAFAAGYSTFRWLGQMKLPLSERFIVDGDALIREVGGREKTRIHYSRMKGIFRNRHAMTLRAESVVVIPVESAGFDSVAQALSKWGDTQRPRNILEDVVAKPGAGLLVLTLVSGAFVYMSVTLHEGAIFAWLVAGVWLGLIVAEVLWRSVAAWAKRTRPTTF
ncbi:MAG: hypothetical protein AB8H86_28640 [Polyangiales bacterium]